MSSSKYIHTHRPDALYPVPQSRRKFTILLVDTIAARLPSAQKTLEGAGFNVIPLHLGQAPAANDIPMRHTTQPAHIIETLLDRRNNVDALVVDLTRDHLPYAHELVAESKKSGFRGPMLVHASLRGDLTNPETMAGRWNEGIKKAAGLRNAVDPVLFETGDWAAIAAALRTAFQARTACR